MRGFALVMACSLVGGCLKIPSPVNDGDGGGDGDGGQSVDAATGPDAWASKCLPPSTFTTSFFAAGATDIRDIVAADVNNDEAMDLVISSQGPSPDDWAVYVLLGPQSTDQDLLVHATIRPNVQPLGLHVEDLIGGDDCLDIAVFGPIDGGSTSNVEVFGQLTAGTQMFPGSAHQRNPGFVPFSDGPVLLASGQFDSATVGMDRDLLVTDLTNLVMISTSGDIAANFASAPLTVIDPSGGTDVGVWTDINAIHGMDSIGDQGADDFVVVEQHSLRWMINDGTGSFSPGADIENSQTWFSARDVELVDLDGTPPIDFVGGSGNTFGAYLVRDAGQDVDVKLRPWNDTLPVYDQLEDIVVADLGGSGNPEVVVIDDDGSKTNPAQVFIVDGLLENGTDLEPLGANRFSFAGEGIDPTRAVAIDFDGDGTTEVWTFEVQGLAKCLRRAGNGTLEVCYK